MAERVKITEVAARDGLQNEPGVIPTSKKIQLVRALLETGADEIEVSSFVSPKWVPQLGDAAEVFAGVAPLKRAGVELSALVPNERGLNSALEVNQRAGTRLIDKVSVFTAASETFSKRNTNASITETLDRFGPVVERAKREGLRIRGYISCAIACPFEGAIDPQNVARVGVSLLDLGVDELDLGDTIGAGEPATIRALLRAVEAHSRNRLRSQGGAADLVVHLHDTFGRAGACALEAFRLGVRWFDGAAGGLGGCPYASTPGKRAPGNIDTETLIRALIADGAAIAVDLGRLQAAASLARSLVADEQDSP